MVPIIWNFSSESSGFAENSQLLEDPEVIQQLEQLPPQHEIRNPVDAKILVSTGILPDTEGSSILTRQPTTANVSISDTTAVTFGYHPPIP